MTDTQSLPPPRTLRLTTPRLTLRPSEPADAVRAFEIQSNWNVTRNLRFAAFPPDRADLAAWVAGHEAEWRAGTAYRFAIERDGRMIGLVDVDGIAGTTGDLGYWLDEPAWGQGLAHEAAAAVVQFVFEQVGLTVLTSGHVADNAASGRVLTKLGFRFVDEIAVPSRSRGEPIAQRRYRLERAAG